MEYRSRLIRQPTDWFIRLLQPVYIRYDRAGSFVAFFWEPMLQINNCDMKSYGWELEMSWRDRIQKFDYGVRLVVSDNQRKILRYPNETMALNTYYKGQILGDIWGYQTVESHKARKRWTNILPMAVHPTNKLGALGAVISCMPISMVKTV